LLGLLSAALVMAGLFLTLRHAGWHPGAGTGPGTPLYHAYHQATTVAWLGIVTRQAGTAFAVRAGHFPFIVWGAGEIRRALARRNQSRRRETA
jgi:hypothetical protein